MKNHQSSFEFSGGLGVSVFGGGGGGGGGCTSLNMSVGHGAATLALLAFIESLSSLIIVL
jgi:hypothetical protein